MFSVHKCKVQSLTFSTGNPLIQVAIVSLQVKLVTILLGWFSKVPHVDLHVPSANGISGAFPSVVPLVHNGSAVWLSSRFLKNFQILEDLMMEVMVQDCLAKNVLKNSQPCSFSSHRELLVSETLPLLFPLSILLFGL